MQFSGFHAGGRVGLDHLLLSTMKTLRKQNGGKEISKKGHKTVEKGEPETFQQNKPRLEGSTL